ncbi:MAG: aminotransferase class I/II-fold pyridoxal phosphate-dependent enzyme [Clostridia bacterium]|nr:aminotransferase class I/II-fold pyridoxal phosphate-dependent enzyme [Clostridia bacterium]
MIDYEKMLARAPKEIKPSGIRRFFDIANSMEGVISLGVGEPDFKTPRRIRNEGIRTLEKGHTGYTANKGMADLLTEISKYVRRKYNVTYDPKSEILVTVGGSEAIDLAVRAIASVGDEVIIPQPSYVCYEPITLLAGATPVIIETKEENNFKLTPDELRAAITERTKALILPYPSNPTGQVLDREDLEAIAEVLRDTNIAVISDEIYAELTFGKKHTSAAAVEGMRERTILVNGFSKAFSMTGWRLGYLCAPAELCSVMMKIHQYAIMCAPTTSQYAAVEALRYADSDVEQMVEEYDKRRLIIVRGFNDMGLTCREPFGAFYAFPSIKSTGLSSEEFCERLLYAKKVAVVPGTAFGASGEGYIRASYCYSLPHIKEALKRIGEFLAELESEKTNLNKS